MWVGSLSVGWIMICGLDYDMWVGSSSVSGLWYVG